MTTVLRFPKPDSFLNLNDRSHWAAKARTMRTWRHAAMVAALAGKVRGLPRCRVVVYLPVRDRRRRDAHNFVATVKPIVDGLVDAGVWPDDTPEWVEVVDPRFTTLTTDVVIELHPDEPKVSPWPDATERTVGLAGVESARGALE